ncbi:MULTISPECIES: sigma-70 family RNA polymerase sigma factor [unclassified Streptomyces]|uniref:sigma-70 family RNA polymerase sigma factor n=1 Tax=unclassified Streptomyces TaxID=2593676 RepID=UPI000A9CCBB3|nr:MULTISPECIES: sigma-70 family RNA polymerase sigma factor [unclassified Streptomyces]
MYFSAQLVRSAPSAVSGASATPAARPSPVEAFDALYAHVAPSLARQAYLLTGRRQLAREAVERAFHQAWERWPEVAVDRDPAGWVRAAAHDHALSPWHRLRLGHTRAAEPQDQGDDRQLRTALLALPAPYRRSLLLFDGLRLGLPETAAETEASTPAAAHRLLHAREAVAGLLPELASAGRLRERLAALLADGPAPPLAPPAAVRSGGERRVRLWVRGTAAMTALIAAATAFTLATAPTRYEPVIAPGEAVAGVPPALGGPPQLTSADRKLRERLDKEPVTGPPRLVPDTR